MKLSRRTVIPALYLAFGATYAAPSPGASILFEFAGLFEECDAACQASPLGVLEGTTFTGTVIIPDAGVDLDSGSPERGLYLFEAPSAEMTVTTADPSLSVSSAAPLDVWVNDCMGSFCFPNQHFVFIWHEGEAYSFSLSFGGNGMNLVTSDAIPDVATFASLFVSFQVYKNDFSEVISTATATFPSPMQAQIAYVPLPPAFGLLAVIAGPLLLRSGRSDGAHATSGILVRSRPT